MNYAHGTINWLTSDAVNGTYAVSGLGFQPKAIRFYWNGIATSGTSVTQIVTSNRGMGFATGTGARRVVATRDVDGSNNMLCVSGYRDDAVVLLMDDSPAAAGRLDLSSLDSDGFTLIIDQVASIATVVCWEAWGGADISLATVGSIAEPAATGNVDYTVTGFTNGATDQVVMLAGVQATGATPTVERRDSGFCVGFASGTASGANVVVTGNNEDTIGTADTDGYCQTGECLAMITVGGGNPNARAQLTVFGADNFRLNWIARGVTDRRYIFLAIKGGKWKAGASTIDGNTLNATMTVLNLGFAPLGLSAIGRMTTQNTAGTSTANDRLSIGCGSSTTSREALGHLSEDGTASCQIDLNMRVDEVLCYPSTTGTHQAYYDIDNLAAGGSFRLKVDLAGGVASEWVGYLTFGSGTPQIGQALETETALALTARKSVPLGLPADAETAQTITPHKVRTVAAGLTTEAESAQSVAHSKARSLGLSADAESAPVATGRKTRAAGLTTESELAQSVVSNPRRRLIGASADAESATALGVTRKTHAVGLDTESESALALTATKARAVGLVTETETAQAITQAAPAAAVGQALESDLAQPISVNPLRRLVLSVTETETARAITVAKGHTLGQGVESELARAVTARKVAGVAQIAETDTARVVAPRRTRGIGVATETDASVAPTARKTRAVALATEADSSIAATARKAAIVGQATETDAAQSITKTGPKKIPVDQALDAESAQPISSRKTRPVALAVESDSAVVMVARKRRSIAVGLATESEISRALTSRKTRALALATESELAQVVSGRKRRTVGVGTETDLGQVVRAGRRLTVAQLLEADLAQPVLHARRYAIGVAVETEHAQDIRLPYIVGEVRFMGLAAPRVYDAAAAARAGGVAAASVREQTAGEKVRQIQADRRVTSAEDTPPGYRGSS